MTIYPGISRPSFLRRILQRAQDCYRWDEYSQRSWSAMGEDMLLAGLFFGRKTGFYVDVGAHHPKRFSNTQYFYERGWRGINVDAMPGSMIEFQKSRPRDVNLEIGVGACECELDYFIFNDPALNGFSREESIRRDTGKNRYKIVDIVKVPVMPLAAILEIHAPPTDTIDFLTIDVEGMDLSVLESNDWQTFRPTCVVAEVLGNQLGEMKRDSVCSFMEGLGYTLHWKCGNSAFFLTDA